MKKMGAANENSKAENNNGENRNNHGRKAEIEPHLK
jgi:hypothetical protein